jgi:hypothetical protein
MTSRAVRARRRLDRLPVFSGDHSDVARGRHDLALGDPRRNHAWERSVPLQLRGEVLSLSPISLINTITRGTLKGGRHELRNRVNRVSGSSWVVPDPCNKWRAQETSARILRLRYIQKFQYFGVSISHNHVYKYPTLLPALSTPYSLFPT